MRSRFAQAAVIAATSILLSNHPAAAQMTTNWPTGGSGRARPAQDPEATSTQTLKGSRPIDARVRELIQLLGARVRGQQAVLAARFSPRARAR